MSGPQGATGPRAAAPKTSPALLVLAGTAVGVAIMAFIMALFFFGRSSTPSDPVVVVVDKPEPPAPPVSPEPPKPPEPPEPPKVVNEPVIVDVSTPRDDPPTGLAKPDPSLRYRVNFDGANLRGPADAPVTIVLFYDVECPFCERVNTSLAEVTARYGSDVRVAYMHNPISWHEAALPAAKALEGAAEQGKFWEMYELLFEDHEDLSRERFDALARQLGLDKRRFERAFDDPAIARRIEAQQAEAARLKARGTPSCFVNGRFLPGAQPSSAFAAVIDEELSVANKLMAEGTRRSDVYDELMKDALPEV